MSILVKALLALALLWGAVAAVMWVAGSKEVTPERLAAYMATNPLADLEAPDAREKLIRNVAAKVNALDYERRWEARQSGDQTMQPFFRSMQPGEFALFVELTAGPHFTKVMQAFNEMDAEERQRIAQETVRQLKEGERMGPRQTERLEAEGVEIFEKVASEGLRAYYQEASAETKIDLAPVLEQMQEVMQNPRRKWKRQ